MCPLLACESLVGQVEQFSIPVPLQEYIKSLHEAISLFGIVSGDMLHVGAHEDQAAGTALAFGGADLFTFLCEKRCAASLQARPGGIRDSRSRGAGQGAVRLLRFATALRVTPLPLLRLRRLVWPKGSLSARQARPENAPV